MSQPQTTGVLGGGPTGNARQVRASIARAAQSTGVDFNYLLAQAKLESSLDPSARASTSSAAALMPQAATANRGIFFAGIAPRPVGAVMELMRSKVSGSMETSFLPSASGEGIEGRGHTTRVSAALRDSPHPNPSPEADGLKARPSMSETLRATSAVAGNAAPAHVRAAYGKLQAFGL